jgi:hypothetical protein
MHCSDLLRANLAHVKPNWSTSLFSGKEISVCCALAVEMVLWHSGVEEQPQSTATRDCHASMMDMNMVINA